MDLARFDSVPGHSEMPAKLSDETIARIMIRRACNMSHNEIAEDLNISEGAVSNHVWDFHSQAEETTPEETVMDRLSPLASVVLAGTYREAEAGTTQHSEER